MVLVGEKWVRLYGGNFVYQVCVLLIIPISRSFQDFLLVVAFGLLLIEVLRHDKGITWISTKLMIWLRQLSDLMRWLESWIRNCIKVEIIVNLFKQSLFLMNFPRILLLISFFISNQYVFYSFSKTTFFHNFKSLCPWKIQPTKLNPPTQP